jgi:hypothetical protein
MPALVDADKHEVAATPNQTADRPDVRGVARSWLLQAEERRFDRLR